LQCGWRDLDILEDCKYSMGELLEYNKDLGGENPDINELCYAMFQMALNDVQEAIDERLEQMREDLNSEEISEKGKAVIEEILDMNLDIRDDVETFHNFIDTHIYIINNESIYMEYFARELEIFDDATGFSFQ
jgi:hypothetical protein